MTTCCACKSPGIAILTATALVTAITGFSAALARQDPKPATPAATEEAPVDIFGFTPNLITGAPDRLENYRGEVILIVNVASKCGMTPQYKELQELFAARQKDGFVILAFPANNFMGQEPGTNEEIAEFCTKEYGVTFPVYEKISVKGEDIHPLYAMLTALPEPVGGEIKWNFDKFLVNREGQVVARFGPRTKPSDAEFMKAVDRLIAEPAP